MCCLGCILEWKQTWNWWYFLGYILQYTSDGNVGVESERLDLDMVEVNYKPFIKFLGKNGYGNNDE